jgi:hypothetical protein
MFKKCSAYLIHAVRCGTSDVEGRFCGYVAVVRVVFFGKFIRPCTVDVQ